jgi:hypothetical protein
MEHIWEINKTERTGIVSREAHQYLHDTGDDELKMSRASAIFFLDDMVEEECWSMRRRQVKADITGSTIQL